MIETLGSSSSSLLAAKGSVLLDFHFRPTSVAIERETSQFLIYARPMPKRLAPSSLTEMEGFSSASELSIRSQSTTAVTPFSFPHAPTTKLKELNLKQRNRLGIVFKEISCSPLLNGRPLPGK